MIGGQNFNLGPHWDPRISIALFFEMNLLTQFRTNSNQTVYLVIAYCGKNDGSEILIFGRFGARRF